MIRNIIFDWSGTLVDDLPAVWKATNHVLRRANRAEMTLNQFRAEFCLPFARFYDRHIPHVPLRRLEEYYHRHFVQVQDSVRELPHARAFLKFCRARPYRTFLLSSIHRDHFAVQSRVTGFGRYLERAYVQVRDKRKKIRQILRENRLRAAETLFVGDMEHDIETARRGGIHSCAVLTGYNTLNQLRAAAPDFIVEHLGELQQILSRKSSLLDDASPSRAQDRAVFDPRLPTATVGALIFNSAGETLLIRTNKWSDLWGIPGGKIKWGEPSLAALRREIREETNLAISDIEFVLVQDCIHSSEFYRDAHFILLNYTCRCRRASNVKLNAEGQEFRWMEPRAALKLPLNRPTRTLLLAVLSQATGSRGKKGKRNHVKNQHR